MMYKYDVATLEKNLGKGDSMGKGLTMTIIIILYDSTTYASFWNKKEKYIA
jgi:hypothetical protein